MQSVQCVGGVGCQQCIGAYIHTYVLWCEVGGTYVRTYVRTSIIQCVQPGMYVRSVQCIRMYMLSEVESSYVRLLTSIPHIHTGICTDVFTILCPRTYVCTYVRTPYIGAIQAAFPSRVRA